MHKSSLGCINNIKSSKQIMADPCHLLFITQLFLKLATNTLKKNSPQTLKLFSTVIETIIVKAKLTSVSGFLNKQLHVGLC